MKTMSYTDSRARYAEVLDSVVNDREVLTAVVSRYGRPPFDVSHAGGVFTTELVERGSTDEVGLQAFNREVLRALGLVRGVSHTEFIKGPDGLWYFLETSARVGGAPERSMVLAMRSKICCWRAVSFCGSSMARSFQVQTFANQCHAEYPNSLFLYPVLYFYPNYSKLQAFLHEHCPCVGYRYRWDHCRHGKRRAW